MPDIELMTRLRSLPCHYCGGEGGEIDHVMPLALGGTNEAANLVACCRHCNASKGAKAPEVL